MMRIYRLGIAHHPVWNGAGAARHGGRWNPQGIPVIYAAGSLALAMLERLVQRRGLGGTVMVEADVPEDPLHRPSDGVRWAARKRSPQE